MAETNIEKFQLTGEDALSSDEADLVCTELFGQMLNSLENTSEKEMLEEFMIPDIDLEADEVGDPMPHGLNDLKKYLLERGLITNNELREKMEALIKRLPDLKLDQEMRIDAMEPSRQKLLKYLAKEDDGEHLGE